MKTPEKALQPAHWIQSDLVGSPFCGVPAPIVRKTITLDTPVTDAVLMWTCIGIAEVTLDGTPVQEGVFLPGWTDLEKRLRVLRINLPPLDAGTHVIEAILGDGWAVGHVSHVPRQYDADRPVFLAKLSWPGGELVTDGTWETQPSHIVQNDLLMGEVVDARLKNSPLPAHPVHIADITPPPLVWHEDPVVKPQEVFPADFLGTVKSKHIYNLGQNISGRCRITVKGDRGASIILRHGELVNEDGSLYAENLRGAKATDIYTLAGENEETYEPVFTFHGFQYVEVEIKGGEVEILRLDGIALYTEMKRLGDFSCSHPLLNQLFSNIVWGQNGNFLEIPTDCPQRDERLGWTGDAQVFAPTAAFIRDTSGFFKKWLADLRDSQAPDGAIPRFAPTRKVFSMEKHQNAGPAWSDAIVFIPWYLYEATGDLSFLAENYQAMVDYMDYLEREEVIDCIQGHPDLNRWAGFGDWLALDGSGNSFGNTPKDLIGTAFYARNAELLAQVAVLLDNPKDAERWSALHSDVRNAFRNRFLTPEGIPTGATQTSCILALHFNLVTDEQRPGCVQELVNRIGKKDPRIGTGFVGTPYILQALEENGHLDLAYQLLEREDFPSWLFPVVHGATTIWERWDGWHPERGFQNKSMNSFNHYAYGAVGEWMIRSVAGITPEEPGYKVIRFKPRPGGSLTQASASLELPRGTASISWRKTETGLKVDLEVPEGHSAILDLPGANPEHLPAGSHHRTA